MVWKPNVVAAAVIEHEGRFLVVEEEAGERIVLNQPAGHLDPGETLLQAVCREVREETAWRFVPTALLGIYQLAVDADLTYLRICFVGTAIDHDPQQPLDHGIIATHWLTAAELAAARERHRSPLVAQCLEDYLSGTRLPLNALQYFQLSTVLTISPILGPSGLASAGGSAAATVQAATPQATSVPAAQGGVATADPRQSPSTPP